MALSLLTPDPPRRPDAGTVAWLNKCIERGKREVFSETTVLSPGLAGELLRRNPDNRHIRPGHAERLASDMRNGNWAFNGEPIILSVDGLLNDGQHRCQAVVDANKCIETVMVFGVDRRTRTTIDQGAARGAADYLSMQGVEYSAIRAAVAKMAIALERSGGQSLADVSKVTNAETVARALRDEEIARSAHFASHVSGRRMIPYAAPSIIALAHYKFAQIDEADADEFITKVCTGEGLKINEPAHTLRDKLLTESKSRDRKLSLFFRAWNFERRGMKVKAANLHTALPLPALM